MLCKDRRDWFSHHSVPFESSDPQSSLSEKEGNFIDTIIHSAEVIALGEMTHGSREIFRSKDRVVRYLVKERGVTVIVLEASLAGTQALNNFVLTGEGDPAASLAETGFWSCANQETLQLVNWLSEYNATQDAQEKKVKVVGCDIQSIDDATSNIIRSLRKLEHQGVETDSVCEVRARVAALPADRKLNELLEPLFKELDADQPNPDRLSAIQRTQADRIGAGRQDVVNIFDLLKRIEPDLAGVLTSEEQFLFGRCIRLIEQCLDHYTFDTGGRSRDLYMAENVFALRELFPGQRVVLTSGNWHIARVPIRIAGTEDYVTTGSLLADRLGDRYCAIASAFHEGKYLGIAGDTCANDIVVDAHVPQQDAFEYSLNAFARDTAVDDFLIDFRNGRLRGELFPWPETLTMNIGEARAKQPYESTFLPQRPHRQYDALLYVTNSTPITVLQEYYLYSRKKWGPSSNLDIPT